MPEKLEWRGGMKGGEKRGKRREIKGERGVMGGQG